MHFIWIQNRRYYYYDEYNTYDECKKEATYHRRRNKSRYYIIHGESGWFFPTSKWQLYLDKVIRL